MKRFLTLILTALVIGLGGCSKPTESHLRGYYMLIDTSGTYTQEIKKAQQIINFILADLNTGETFAVARVDSGSFSEKDIVAKVTFDSRPSVTNDQKRQFREKVDKFVKTVKPAAYTDISGGLLQASAHLTETGVGKKTILIFSDMKEELPKGHKRDFTVPLEGFGVFAVNVTKLRSDNVDPREYLDRLEEWRKKVETGGGEWKVINDLERLDALVTG